VSPQRRLIIAIDGPAGAGKSTLAARIASRFGLLKLETGAMYRAFALKALEQGVAVDDAPTLERLAAETTIQLVPDEGSNRVILDGVDVTPRLRDPEVTEAASQVSVHPAVRQWMVDLQRQMGQDGGVVMEGRDIGTAVFPDAEVKVFLDAAPEVRGQRRFQQSGPAEASAPESVLKEIRERDQRDRTRAQSPLRPAPDAVIIDSTNLTLDEVVARMEALVTERMVAR
jgi:CMP/dCMP kinase